MRLAAIDWSTADGFELNGLKREALIAAGSMLLHEIYFDSLGGAGSQLHDTTLAAVIDRDFGSLSRWQAEFAAMGKALGGGSGWVVLSWSERLGRLVNQWAADHAHSLVDSTPVLALDMYEHAYHLDFGPNAGAYVDAYMRNINWGRVAQRYQRAVVRPAEVAATEAPNSDVSVTGLATMAERDERAPLVFDVRLADDYADGRDQLPDAPWRDPQRIEEWAEELPRGVPVVVYCKYGGWVSQDTAAALRDQGIEAHGLAGGISAWRAMGYPTVPLESQPPSPAY